MIIEFKSGHQQAERRLRRLAVVWVWITPLVAFVAGISLVFIAETTIAPGPWNLFPTKYEFLVGISGLGLASLTVILFRVFCKRILKQLTLT